MGELVCLGVSWFKSALLTFRRCREIICKEISSMFIVLSLTTSLAFAGAISYYWTGVGNDIHRRRGYNHDWSWRLCAAIRLLAYWPLISSSSALRDQHHSSRITNVWGNLTWKHRPHWDFRRWRNLEVIGTSSPERICRKSTGQIRRKGSRRRLITVRWTKTTCLFRSGVIAQGKIIMSATNLLTEMSFSLRFLYWMKVCCSSLILDLPLLTCQCYHEATSAIDLETDKAVQEILQGPQFANTTILTIA